MKLKHLARIMIVLIIILMIIGSSLVLSASSRYSELRFDNFYKMFFSHLVKVGVAIVFLLFFSSVPYELYKKWSKYIVLGTAGLLVITLIVAPNVKGAGRWLNLGFFSFQPSEIAKFALLIHVAALIERKGKEMLDLEKGYLYVFFWIIMMAGLVFIQPNVSTSIIIFVSSFSLLFVGDARLKHMFSTLAITGSAAAVFMMMFSHSRARILTFFNSVQNGGEINIQVAQAKIALGSGGFIGVGLGQSRQSNLFLPEAYGDFIFSILGEETGFLGTIGVLIIYILIFFCGIVIAKKAKDVFGQLLAFGISFTIILCAFINAAVVTGVFPTTGIPLPFISYGGTNIWITCIAAGIVINIAMTNYKYADKEKSILQRD